jgi:murein DD-endopeptidase MepM/ murein hydrolase activator NlpD
MTANVLTMFKLIAIAIAVFSFTQQLFEPPDIWATPVPYFEVHREFQAPITLRGQGHRGVDFLVEKQGPVQSPTAGTMHFAGKVVDENYLTIKTTAGLLVSFAGTCSALAEGAYVSKGQVIGFECSSEVGSEAHCPSCSHMSVRSDHGYLNPELFLGLVHPSVIKS